MMKDENVGRKAFTVRMDKDIVDEFKVFCIINQMYQYEVIEDLLNRFLKTDEINIEKYSSKGNEESKGPFTVHISQNTLMDFKIYCAINKVYQYEVLEKLLLWMFDNHNKTQKVGEGENGNTNK